MAGDEIRIGPGETLRITTTTAATGGRFVEVEATYEPGKTRPPLHCHPQQQELIEVLSGSLKGLLDGRRLSLSPGDVIEVPMAAVHTMWNDGPGLTKTRWRTTPALKTEEFFFSLDTWIRATGGAGTLRGVLSAPSVMLRFREEFRLASPPYALQRVMFPIMERASRILHLPPGSV